MSNLYYDEIDSPIGALLVVFHGDDIVRIDYGTMEIMEQRLKKWTERYFTEPVFIKSPDKAAPVKRDFDDYFNGESKAFSFPFTFDGTPYGKTTTYKDIAIKIQNPKAVRAVGGAVNKNPLSIVVPCHRVIGSSGKMVGYNGGLDKKEYLLTFEKNNAS